MCEVKNSVMGGNISLFLVNDALMANSTLFFGNFF